MIARPFFAGAEENPLKVLASTVEEKAKPLIEAATPAKEEKPEKDKRKKTYLDKINEDRRKFYAKEQERKAKFIDKMRDRGMSNEERQSKAEKFHAKEMKRKQKFAEKVNREVLKNTQRG